MTMEFRLGGILDKFAGFAWPAGVAHGIALCVPAGYRDVCHARRCPRAAVARTAVHRVCRLGVAPSAADHPRMLTLRWGLASVWFSVSQTTKLRSAYQLQVSR